MFLEVGSFFCVIFIPVFWCYKLFAIILLVAHWFFFLKNYQLTYRNSFLIFKEINKERYLFFSFENNEFVLVSFHFVTRNIILLFFQGKKSTKSLFLLPDSSSPNNLERLRIILNSGAIRLRL